ncbi:MAG: (deoxy)nucleoside triphosphate pyrophosphohydrolase [Rhodospirillaceae bacterium]|jgi:8-oxo-dGTP diphosphatase|nr:(deoxy)nucleoside triphosphate pyrophosphohydrolase [Rhodospirillaceae bacterium]
MSAIKVVTVVAVGLIRDDGAILLTKRPEGKAMAGLWEFPGGKLEEGETPEHALVRELREELGISVNPPALQPLTFASHTYDSFHLLMPIYTCKEWSGKISPQENQAMAWVMPDQLSDYPMPEADLPLVPFFNEHPNGVASGHERP